MTDDITRLAERDALIAKMIAHHETWAVELADMDSAEAKFHKDAAAKLREIAQQGKAGGVADLELLAKEMMSMSDKAGSAGETDVSDTWCAASIMVSRMANRKTAQPANPPEAGVTDEMVRRARGAYAEARYEGNTCSFAMRAALTAALAPQTKDAT